MNENKAKVLLENLGVVYNRDEAVKRIGEKDLIRIVQIAFETGRRADTMVLDTRNIEDYNRSIGKTIEPA